MRRGEHEARRPARRRPAGSSVTGRSVTGTGPVATIVLGLLVLGCVFVAVAGPRESVATRTQALRQTLAATPQLVRSVTGSADWEGFTSALPGSSRGQQLLSIAELTSVTSQLRAGLARDGVPVTRTADEWAGLTTKGATILSAVPPAADPAGTSALPLMEVLCRTSLARYGRLVQGSYPGRGRKRVLQVAVTRATAERFGLSVGSKVLIRGPAFDITLDVTGILQPRQPGLAYWNLDPDAAVPGLTQTTLTSYWSGAALASPAEAGQLQTLFRAQDLTMTWELPLALGSVSAERAQALASAIGQATTQAVTLQGLLAPSSSAVSLTSPVQPTLAAFLVTQASVQAAAWLLFVSLTVIGAVVLLLAARLVAARRSAEFTLLRARGASMTQVALLAVRGMAVVCLPAAAAGLALALALTRPAAGEPLGSPGGSWWLGGIVLGTALAAPAIAICYQQRRRRDRSYAGLRFVAELGLTLAALAGLIVFRDQAGPAASGSGINVYASAAPVLIAIPVVLILARLYPAILHGAGRLTARRAGAPAFIALARAPGAPALTAFALVMALTLAAFGGMVRDAISRGQADASWRTAGADALITAGSAHALTPAAARAIAALPGVRHAAVAWDLPWTLPGGQKVTGIAVSPSSYAALVASTQTWPRMPARALRPGTVIASPRVAAYLGHGPAVLTNEAGLPPVRVRVATTLTGTPALPGTGSFLILPVTAIRGVTGPPPDNLMLLTGSISGPDLTRVVHRVLPGATVVSRAAVLASLTSAPLQHGTYLIFALAILAAAGFAIAAMALDLAMSAGDRDTTLAYLAAMGLAPGQQARLVLAEVLPALVAAGLAAVACAAALPRLIAPALNLSVFTGSSARVAVTPDAASLGLPLAALLVLAVAALAAEAWRRRDITARLREAG
jgi:putative ABC transport system permease protein